MAEFRETSGNVDDGPAPTAERLVAFGDVRFDSRTGALWQADAETRVTPRAAQVLSLLAERSQQLVTKQDLLDRVWGGLAVGDDALTSCVQELRRALGDDARKPRYIETHHRRGYRLIVPAVAPVLQSLEPAPQLVGREAPLAELARHFDRTRAGRRQFVLLSGEPGIGKTALVDAFLRTLPAGTRIAHGQCLDHHGAGEPYLPLIEALARVAGEGAVARVLADKASTRERMLRDLTGAVETIAAEAPLVLKLEDLHWSDSSTLDWLAHVMRRPEPARLMILATFRPADTSTELGRLLAELALHGHCHDIALEPLTGQTIEDYLQARLGDLPAIGDLARQVLARTGGNPLFMASLVRQLAGPGDGAALSDAISTVPPDVRRFIDNQIDGLADADRALLMAASTIGRAFATAGAAAALDTDAEALEAACARLGRHGVFIAPAGGTAWPDGGRSDLYVFRHDLHRELLYDRLPATRRALCHLRVACRLEAAWARQPGALAAALADHFERGQEPTRAIPHLQRAADRAQRRGANAVALGYLQRALAGTGGIADPIERGRTEAELQVAIGAAHMATHGFGAPEVAEAYTRAAALCERLGERADLFPALWGQWLFRWGRSELDEAERLGTRLLALGEKSGDAGLQLQAHHAMWATLFGRGRLAQSRAHAEAALLLYEPERHRDMASRYGNHDACACAHNFTAVAAALAGEPDAAWQAVDRALAMARPLDDPFSLALAHYFGAVAAQIADDVERARLDAGKSLAMANEHGLALPRVWSTGLLGWCAAREGDIARGFALLDTAIAGLEETQSKHFMHYLLALQAETLVHAGRLDDARRIADRGIGLAESTGERFYLAELYRLRGDRVSLEQAIAIARQSGALTLERRAQAALSALIPPEP